MEKKDLHGFVPAVVTPFNERGDLMEDAFQTLVKHFYKLGAVAICVAGDNGEAWALSIEERGRLTQLAVDAVHGNIPIITGCSATGLQDSVSFAQVAEEHGASAVLSMPQTYVLKTTREELLTRFEKLGRSIHIPIVAYNSPRRSGLALSPLDIEAIMGVAPIIGIKESSRDFFHHTELIETLGHKLAIMVGPCHFIVPGLAMGAAGFIATGPEFLGKQAQHIPALARAAASEARQACHFKLTKLYQVLMGTGTWPASLKAALNLMGLPAGVPRDPVHPATPVMIEKIKQTFEELEINHTS